MAMVLMIKKMILEIRVVVIFLLIPFIMTMVNLSGCDVGDDNGGIDS